MDRLDWGKLPTETIELISQIFLDERERSVEWRILNKHWFDATSRSFYRKVSILAGIDFASLRQLEEELALKRLNSFCYALKNSQYNIGQYVKVFSSSCNLDQHLDLLDSLMKYFPHLQTLYTPMDEKVMNNITAQYYKLKEEENIILWKKLQVLSQEVYDVNNCLYRCCFNFCESLTSIEISSFKSNMKYINIQESKMLKSITEQNESTQGNGDDVSRYIGSFKQLKDLSLTFDASDSILVLEKYLCHCSYDLTSLCIFMLKKPIQPVGGTGGGIGGGSNALGEISSLNKLKIWKYTPQNIYSGINYIKRKFVNLDSLFMTRQDGVSWTRLPSANLDYVMGYLYSLRDFEVHIDCGLTSSFVNPLFNSFINHQGSKDTSHRQQVVFDLALRKGCLEGIEIGYWPDNDISGRSTTMQVLMNVKDFYQQDPAIYQAKMTQFNQIIQHIRRGIHTYKVNFHGGRNNHSTSKILSSSIVENVLVACPDLQTLSTKETRFIDIDGTRGSTFPDLQTLEISRNSRYQDRFLSRMSARAPSLQHVKLAISRQEESNSSFNISMPSTRFKHLELKVTMNYNDDDISITDKDQEINAKVTTMKKNNSGLQCTRCHSILLLQSTL